MIDPNSYLIMIEGGPPTNYGAWSPEVLGCVATGDTVDECVTNMRDALAFHLETMEADGDDIPEGTGGVYIELSSAAIASAVA